MIIMMTVDKMHQPPASVSVSRIAAYGWLALLGIIAIFIRMRIGLVYSNDEAMHMDIASADTLAEVLRYSRYEAHPPLLYICLHYWMKISSDPLFMHCFPLLLGLALIPLYYRIGLKLGDRLCGLSCATLITFSYGCILQSYLMRQYCVFLLAMSLNFYCYLYWRDHYRRSLLLAYTFFGWLAVFSHFSAILYFSCIVIFETLSLLHKAAPRRVIAEWVLANAAIAVPALILYSLWRTALIFYGSHYHYFWNRPHDIGHLVTNTLGAPFFAAYYLYPAIPFLPFMLIYLFLPQCESHKRINLRPYLHLASVACLMSMAIYLFKFYPVEGQRHCLWMLPLVLPVAGVAAADMLEQATVFLRYFPIRAILMLMFYCAVFDTELRSRDGEFNDWQAGPWQTITHELDTLGPDDIIITDKDGATLLASMYPYKSNAELMDSAAPALVPYHHTHILVSADYFGDYSPKAVRAMIQRAQASHMLDNVNRFVFVKLWTQLPIHDIALCNALEKKVFYPLVPAGFQLNSSNFAAGRFAVIAVSKETFMRDVISLSGKATLCLDENHAPIFNFTPFTAKHNAP